MDRDAIRSSLAEWGATVSDDTLDKLERDYIAYGRAFWGVDPETGEAFRRDPIDVRLRKGRG